MSTSERSAKATPQGRPRMSKDLRLHTRVAMAPGAGLCTGDLDDGYIDP
jgi:hypothetical protein